MTLDLDRLRRQAKDLHKSYETGETGALDRVRAVIPPGRAALKRADFLHVIARENTFVSWPALKEAVDLHGADRAAKVQRLRIGLANGQARVVARLLEETPDLARGIFGLEVALLQAGPVLAALDADPGLATTESFGRRPMVSLAFSHAIHIWPEREQDMLRIARALVAHGADVNDAMDHPDGPLSVLYGAIGHANNMALGKWLLENGADPNDGESLYHATELGHHDGLRMLLDHGADPRGTTALGRAMDFDDLTAVEMLLTAGADPNHFEPPSGRPDRNPLTPLHQAARRMVSPEICKALLNAGADPFAEADWASAYAFARVYGNRALARLIEDRGATPLLSREEALLAAAADGAAPEGAYIDEAQLPAPYVNIIREILHLPGKLPHIRALVDLGLFYDRPDGEGLTPVQVAGWEGLVEVMGYFLSLSPDLGHINGYGGTLLSTIIHGSENCPPGDHRDHIACARMALEQGVALPKRAIALAGEPQMAAFLSDWADRYPGQVVAHGVA